MAGLRPAQAWLFFLLAAVVFLVSFVLFTGLNSTLNGCYIDGETPGSRAGHDECMRQEQVVQDVQLYGTLPGSAALGLAAFFGARRWCIARNRGQKELLQPPQPPLIHAQGGFGLPRKP